MNDAVELLRAFGLQDDATASAFCEKTPVSSSSSSMSRVGSGTRTSATLLYLPRADSLDGAVPRDLRTLVLVLPFLTYEEAVAKPGKVVQILDGCSKSVWQPHRRPLCASGTRDSACGTARSQATLLMKRPTSSTLGKDGQGTMQTPGRQSGEAETFSRGVRMLP
jgi:hypothetical protein